MHPADEIFWQSRLAWTWWIYTIRGMKACYCLRILVTAGLLFTCGCASAGGSGGADIHVRLNQDGRIYVGETYTGLPGMAAQLRKDGVKAQTMIMVEIPQNTSPDAMSAIGRELASNGYRLFIFSKPRKAVAEKGVDPLLKNLR